MARILGYIASSLDGFIATPDDKLDWLTQYDDMDFGDASYEKFIASVRTLIMGRRTYEWVLQNAGEWPYRDRHTLVLTSRPLVEQREKVEAWTAGVDALVDHARGLDSGDVWMVGGGALQMAFLERGALDELAITVVPQLIGGGFQLFPPTGFAASPTLVSAKALDRGVVHLRYRFG